MLRAGESSCQTYLRFGGDDVNAAAFAVEHDRTVNQCEQGVVFALTNAFAWMPFIADLADEDVTGDNALATEFFDSTSLGVGIATVAAGALSFFMGHLNALLKDGFLLEDYPTMWFTDRLEANPREAP
jgi:hypothetical protein